MQEAVLNEETSAPGVQRRRGALQLYETNHLISHGLSGISEKSMILEMLLDGASASLARARACLEFASDQNDLRRELLRASRIVAGLYQALDGRQAPTLVDELKSIYRHFCVEVHFIKSERDLDRLDRLSAIIATLRSAFLPPRP